MGTDPYGCQPIVVAEVDSERDCHLPQVVVGWLDAPVMEKVPNQPMVILPKLPCGWMHIDIYSRRSLVYFNRMFTLRSRALLERPIVMRNFLLFMEPKYSLSNLHDPAKSEALREVGLVWFIPVAHTWSTGHP
jgi:hypothetical protein